MKTTLRNTLRGVLVAALAVGSLAGLQGGAQAEENDDVSPLIIGGQPAEGEHPWMVSLDMFREDGTVRFTCGGSLINSRWVLTAAHCVFSNRETGQLRTEIYPRIGSNDRTSGGIETTVTDIVVHPEYLASTDSAHADLALLKLDSPVGADPTDFLQIAAAEPGVGSWLTVFGWGTTTPPPPPWNLPAQLQQTRVQITPDEVCDDGTIYGITEGDLCVSDPEQLTGPCNGDSGSPAVSRVKDRWQLVGVVSRGTGECATGPGVFVSAPYHAPWIRSVVSG